MCFQSTTQNEKVWKRQTGVAAKHAATQDTISTLNEAMIDSDFKGSMPPQFCPGSGSGGPLLCPPTAPGVTEGKGQIPEVQLNGGSPHRGQGEHIWLPSENNRQPPT